MLDNENLHPRKGRIWNRSPVMGIVYADHAIIYVCTFLRARYKVTIIRGSVIRASTLARRRWARAPFGCRKPLQIHLGKITRAETTTIATRARVFTYRVVCSPPTGRTRLPAFPSRSAPSTRGSDARSTRNAAVSPTYSGSYRASL